MPIIPFPGFSSSSDIAGSPITITVVSGVTGTPTPGSVDDTAYDIIRKSLNPALAGPNWNALIAALATGDDANNENTELGYDQLHISSASGEYLDRLCADHGVPRPPLLGISDEKLRELTISITNNKLTLEAFLEVLRIFYGDDATRAHAISGNAQPFALVDGSTLTFLLDERDSIVVNFSAADYSNIGSASAQEVCDTINRVLANYNSNAFAVPIFDPSSGGTFIHLYSSALGLAGSVRVTGGQAENVLLFQTPLNLTYIPSTTWTVSTYPTASAPGLLRFAPSTSWDFSSLIPGDYLNLYGSEFNSANIGTWTIVNITASYFEVSNIKGVTQSVIQANQSDLLFFRPTKNTIQNLNRIASAIQADPAETIVSLPATSGIVSRDTSNASYLHTQKSYGIKYLSTAVTTASTGWNIGTVTVNTTAPHTIVAGDTVLIDGAYGPGVNGMFVVLPSPITSTTFTYNTFQRAITFNNQPFQPTFAYTAGMYVSPTGNNHIFICTVAGTSAGSEPAWNLSKGSVTVSGGAKFVEFGTQNGTVTSFTPVSTDNYLGPYSFDVKNGPGGITAVSTTLNQPLLQGSTYRQVYFANTTLFPDQSGYIMFGYGTKYQVGPVHYLSRPSGTGALGGTLLLDSSFVFPLTIPVGTDVTLLIQKAPYIPTQGTDPGIAYVTGSNLGRVFASKTIDNISAAGVDIDKQIVYPGPYGLADWDAPYTGNRINGAIYVWGDDNEVDIQTARNGGS